MNGRSLIGRSTNSAISSRHLYHLRNLVKSGLTIRLEGTDMPFVWMQRLFAAAQVERYDASPQWGSTGKYR